MNISKSPLIDDTRTTVLLILQLHALVLFQVEARDAMWVPLPVHPSPMSMRKSVFALNDVKWHLQKEAKVYIQLAWNSTVWTNSLTSQRRKFKYKLLFLPVVGFRSQRVLRVSQYVLGTLMELCRDKQQLKFQDVNSEWCNRKRF